MGNGIMDGQGSEGGTSEQAYMDASQRKEMMGCRENGVRRSPMGLKGDTGDTMRWWWVAGLKGKV